MSSHGFLSSIFLSDPTESITCGICLDVFNDPHKCRNGHNFCFGCITEALRTGNKCPMCRTALHEKSLVRNISLGATIGRLTVNCPNQQTNDVGKCSWSGSINDTTRHFTLCPLQLVGCPLKKVGLCSMECTGSCPHHELAKHVSKFISLNAVTLLLFRLKYKMAAAGHRTITSKYGSIYIGEVRRGKRHGTGVTTLDNGAIQFCNNWVNDKICGHGILQTSGHTIIGEFKNSLPHGVGCVQYASGASYIGEWGNGQYHGYGVNNSYSLIGMYSKGKLEGKAVVKYANGNTYDGHWKNGGRNGAGIMKYANGDSYDGMWAHNQRHGGKGTSVLDSKHYVGEFKYGKYHGRGI